MANDKEYSPISFLSNLTSEAVVDWLDTLDHYNRRNILKGIGISEIKKVLNLAPDLTERFFNTFIHEDPNFFPSISQVKLTEYPYDK